jgi:serine/threonine protein kinase
MALTLGLGLGVRHGVHRDLKPSNTLVDENMNVKVATRGSPASLMRTPP